MFGFPNHPDFGRVIAVLSVEDELQCRAMLRAVEMRLRSGASEPTLEKWRRQLLNMRWRAFVEGWRGWA